MLLDSRVHDLLSIWETAAVKPSPEVLCVDCPDLLPEIRQRLGQLEQVNATLTPADRPKPQIPGYEIERLIGEGGMGTVWRAVQIGTKRPVAMKFLAGWRGSSPRLRERFVREVELASRLQHPHI